MLWQSKSFLRSPNQCNIPTAPRGILAREGRGSPKKYQTTREINHQNHQVTGKSQEPGIPITIKGPMAAPLILLRESTAAVTGKITEETAATIPEVLIEKTQGREVTIPDHQIGGIRDKEATIPAPQIEGNPGREIIPGRGTKEVETNRGIPATVTEGMTEIPATDRKDMWTATGRTVTGLDYFAWKMGPVPVELYEEIDMPEPDLAEKVEFAEKPTRRGTMLVVKPIAGFDDSHFTRRELRILKGLAAEFRDAQADDMIETTHLENQPWHKVYVEEGQRQGRIPYELALRTQEAEAMRDVIAERQAFVDYFHQE